MSTKSVTASVVTQKTYPSKAFDTVLVLTDKAGFAEPFRVYQDLTTFLADNQDAALIEAGTILFSQEPRLTSVILAKTVPLNADPGALAADMVLIDAVLDVDFFAVTVVSDHSDTQLVELAKYIESQEMIGCFYCSDAATITTGTTDLNALLQAENLEKSFVWYHATTRLDLAFISRFLGEPIGNVSGKHLVLTGVEASNLTSSELTNALGKYANVYDRERKKYVFTKQGITANGESIESVAGKIFVTTSCIEAAYELLLNNSRISFNATDVKKIESKLLFELKKAQEQKIIAADDPVNGASYQLALTPDRAADKMTASIIYLDAGTLKTMEIAFTVFKDDTQFNIEKAK